MRTHLFAVVSHRRQNGAQRFDPHGNVEEMSREEEVVVVSKNGHQQIPNQVQESLRRQSRGVRRYTFKRVLKRKRL